MRPDVVVDGDGLAHHVFHLPEIFVVAVEEPPVFDRVVHPFGQCVVQRVARLRHAYGRLHAAQGVDVFLRAVLGTAVGVVYEPREVNAVFRVEVQSHAQGCQRPFRLKGAAEAVTYYHARSGIGEQ